MTEPTPLPRISIVIPVYNEEAILRTAITDLRERLSPLGWDYEIILAENGSKDKTAELAQALCEKYPELRALSVDEPNYGTALRAGIRAARGEFVLCDEIDLCDTDFHQAAVQELESGATDLVIGSKLIAGARDERPMVRHLASIAYTGLLRGLLGFRGTDTHGLKAFRRSSLLPVVEACVADRDVFASEFVIRSYRSGQRVVEIPIRILEKRPPSINLFKRVPNVLTNLAKLTWAIRVRG
ncbi:MAG TPA: glycosyltransferase family 2 protein [Polyangiaceae bacterium]|nr:glycosyltransferase family 2 protein [Polyangiaceae bacterium]